MSIKFNCPHCDKVLRVKDELAGKRAKYPACGQVLSIPAQASAAVDAEAWAAAALADQPKAEPKPAAAPAGTIDFRCYYCDEDVKMPMDLAGKQAPCPQCRRIIKVPLPVKTEPKDWRK